MSRILRARARMSRRGMTLIEAMVAIAILVVMSAVVVESLRNAIEFHNLLSNRDVTVRTARVALSKLKRDIQLSYLTPNRTVPDRFQTVFVGMDEEPDKLFFASLNHQRLYLDSRESDMTEITVWAERNMDGPGYTLYHREAPRIDEEPDEDGIVWPLAYNVRSFRLRYLDPLTAEWREEWDTRGADTPYRLPRAVEIGMVLIAPDPEDPSGERTVDVPFLSTVQVEYACRLPGPQAAVGAGGSAGGGNTCNQGGLGGAGANGLATQAPPFLQGLGGGGGGSTINRNGNRRTRNNNAGGGRTGGSPSVTSPFGGMPGLGGRR